MKKVVAYILILFLSLILITSLKAEVQVKSFNCFYNVKTSADLDIGQFQFIVSNYNDGTGNASLNIYYQNENKKFVEYTGGSTISDYYNNEQQGSQYIAVFAGSGGTKIAEASKRALIDSFTKTGKCPRIYYTRGNGSDDRLDVERYSDNNYKAIDAIAINFKGPNDTNWISEADFKKRTGTQPTTPPTTGDPCMNITSAGECSSTDGCKWDYTHGCRSYTPTTTPPTETDPDKGFECNYQMAFYGVTNKSSVDISKVVHNGYTTYYISIDGNKEEIKSLDEQFTTRLGQYSSGEVRILPEDLKAIYNRSDCLDATKLYHYEDNSLSQTNVFYITVDKQKASEEGTAGKYGDATGDPVSEDPGNKNGKKPDAPEIGFGTESMPCSKLLGQNLTTIVRVGVKALQIIGAILAIVWGMMSLIPAIMSKDSDGLKKAGKKLVLMAIILLCIFLLPYLARFIGNIFDFDTSCLFDD